MKGSAANHRSPAMLRTIRLAAVWGAAPPRYDWPTIDVMPTSVSVVESGGATAELMGGIAKTGVDEADTAAVVEEDS
jgi:hypothetical protein